MHANPFQKKSFVSPSLSMIGGGGFSHQNNNSASPNITRDEMSCKVTREASIKNLIEAVKNYDLDQFFKDESDETKLLATITNEYSPFNSSLGEANEQAMLGIDNWHSLSRIILSDLEYRAVIKKNGIK